MKKWRICPPGRGPGRDPGSGPRRTARLNDDATEWFLVRKIGGLLRAADHSEFLPRELVRWGIALFPERDRVVVGSAERP